MENHNKTASKRVSIPHAELVQNLINCALACEACAAACLTEEDVNMMTRCIELDRDCSDICFQAARLLMRDSEVSAQYLSATEEICRLCAEECNKHDHEHCKVCAEACFNCAEACRNSSNNVIG